MAVSFFQSIRKKSAILFAVIIGMIVLNNIVFLHAHRLENGKIVVHAHPYNKNQEQAPFKNHYHSTDEFLLLTHLQLMFFVLTLLVGLLVKNLQNIKWENVVFYYKHLCYSCSFGRAPPSSSLLLFL